MYLHEIESGSKATIVVKVNGQTLTFQTIVEEATENGILTEPIYRNEKLVGFKAKGLTVGLEVSNTSDQKVYEFIDVEVLNVKTKDEKIHHKIVCKTQGRPINRRAAVRVWVGIDGVARIGLDMTLHEVFIKDISISGISFVYHKDLDVEPGMLAQITFLDPKLKMKFSISSIIVRKAVVGEGKILYGCKMNQENPAVAKYISEKQREKLKASRTVGTTVPLETR